MFFRLVAGTCGRLLLQGARVRGSVAQLQQCPRDLANLVGACGERHRTVQGAVRDAMHHAGQ